MSESAAETKKKLLESAKKEFLEKGFNGASLRSIAANAGVTTGAMYRHFKDKNAFFCALVDDVIDYVTQMIMLANTENHALFDSVAIEKHMSYETTCMVISMLLHFCLQNLPALHMKIFKMKSVTFTQKTLIEFINGCINRK